jgi:CheY-like chemotaxis protein
MYLIICVDDDPIILQMLDFQLRKNVVHPQLTFEFFEDPEKALDAIAEFSSLDIQPILLVTDYQMPHMNGAILIRKMKEKIAGLSCLMLSGQANAIQVDDLVNEDLLDAFVTKPWDEKELIGSIVSILDRKNITLPYNS